MFDLNPSFSFNFSFSKIFKSNKDKHELQYQDFLKSLDGLQNDNVINLISLKLLNGNFDLLKIIKDNEIIKMIGDFNNDIIQKFKIIRIPIKKNGKVKFTLILGYKNKSRFKLKYDYIELLGSYLN